MGHADCRREGWKVESSANDDQCYKFVAGHTNLGPAIPYCCPG